MFFSMVSLVVLHDMVPIIIKYLEVLLYLFKHKVEGICKGQRLFCGAVVNYTVLVEPVMVIMKL